MGFKITRQKIENRKTIKILIWNNKVKMNVILRLCLSLIKEANQESIWIHKRIWIYSHNKLS